MINLNATLVIQIVVFLALMVLLNKYLFKPMVQVLEERKERTEIRRKKATQVDGEAEGIWAEYQKRIHEARLEGDRARDQLLQQGEAERQKLVETASSQADKTVTEVRARVRAELQEARKTLEVEAKSLAASVAQKILERAV